MTTDTSEKGLEIIIEKWLLKVTKALHYSFSGNDVSTDKSNDANNDINKYSPTGLYNAIIAPQSYIHKIKPLCLQNTNVSPVAYNINN
ncbi:MAG: hypothetical protein HY738_16090 [Bacteroidia bacterium]|nr:hypothetical protein [Bacteroidia bacterium]